MLVVCEPYKRLLLMGEDDKWSIERSISYGEHSRRSPR